MLFNLVGSRQIKRGAPDLANFACFRPLLETLDHTEAILILMTFLRFDFKAPFINQLLQLLLRKPNLPFVLMLFCLSFGLGLLFPGIEATAFPESGENALKIQFEPPDTGEESAPQDRPRGGGTRPSCSDAPIRPAPCANLELTALVPYPEIVRDDGQGRSSKQPSAWGRTIAEIPTFWYYIPYPATAIHRAEFELWDKDGHLIIQDASVQIAETPGVIGYLPDLEEPLEVGKTYHWHLILRLDPDNPSLDEYVSGRIQRVAFSPEQAGQLAVSSPLQQADLLAAAGIWYDTLTALAKVYRDAPATWIALLRQVELDEIAEEPLVDCCLLGE